MLVTFALLALSACGSVEPTATPIAAPATSTPSAESTLPSEPTATTNTRPPLGNPQSQYVPPTALVGTPRPGAVATLTAAPRLNTGTLTIINANGFDVNIHVEIADTQPSRELGLMHRTDMGVDEGMIFDFGGETTGGFWMQNTLLPLSIAFITADGTIINIEDMQPLDTNITAAAGTYSYALETNQGWFRANNILPGGKVLLPVALDSANNYPIPGMPACPAPAMAMK